MTSGALHLILVGGGLANGLLAYRLALRRPEVRFLLLEAGPTLGGHHTWSFHGTDVPPACLSWLEPLCAGRWTGHEVRFPSLTRVLEGTYHSLRSTDLDRALRPLLGERVRVSSPVVELGPTSVVLASGERLVAQAVVDGRGPSASGDAVGFQKFLGQELVLAAPHGASRPVLMDATVEQLDGFRFVYALPWDERRVLVEDTYYSDTPRVEPQVLRERIRAWAAARGWSVSAVAHEECAALPIPLFARAPRLTHPTLGVAAGLFHATTGYSLPFAAAAADELSSLPEFDAARLTSLLQREARRHHRSQGFFRMLNRMLFLAAPPSERVRVFESFYRHDEGLIARFYAGRLTAADKLKALRRGAPTVPPMPAVRAALGW